MRKIYVVHYHGEQYSLTVSLDGKSVPMDEFVQTHTPIQVTPLTLISPGVKVQAFIGLLIAEEVTASAELASDERTSTDDTSTEKAPSGKPIEVTW